MKMSNPIRRRSSALSLTLPATRSSVARLHKHQFLFDTNERFSLRPHLATQATQSKALRLFCAIQVNDFLCTPILQRKQNKALHFFLFNTNERSHKSRISPIELASTSTEGNKMFSGSGTVVGTGFIPNRSTPVQEVVRGEAYIAAENQPLIIPEQAVVVPGTRPINRGQGQDWGLSLYAPVIVKYRNAKTDLRAQLEELLH